MCLCVRAVIYHGSCMVGSSTVLGYEKQDVGVVVHGGIEHAGLSLLASLLFGFIQARVLAAPLSIAGL